MTSPSKPRPTAAERFLTKVDITGDCWNWAASTDGLGYGQFYVGEQKFKAHRWSYELLVGPIPEGLSLDHLCRNPSCVRPSHLEPVTHRENVLRGTAPTAINAAKTHCLQGHPYDDENTTVTTKGHRQCQACHRERERAAMRRRRAQADPERRHPCSECGLPYATRADGTLHRHHGMTPSGFSTGEQCPGANKPPRI